MITRIKSVVFCFLFTGVFFFASAQTPGYNDSVEAYFKKYVKEHEVVKEKDKNYMQFFPVDEKFRIVCSFERKTNNPWFLMETSGPVKKNYRVYGTIHFTVNDTAVILNIYQSQDLMAVDKYRHHLFIPFTDATSGEETYTGGRYIDLYISDIAGDKYVIDFNKAYNPYCAYVSDKYNCPIPPKENELPVSIRAGEKAFLKNH